MYYLSPSLVLFLLQPFPLPTCLPWSASLLGLGKCGGSVDSCYDWKVWNVEVWFRSGVLKFHSLPLIRHFHQPPPPSLCVLGPWNIVNASVCRSAALFSVFWRVCFYHVWCIVQFFTCFSLLAHAYLGHVHRNWERHIDQQALKGVQCVDLRPQQLTWKVQSKFTSRWSWSCQCCDNLGQSGPILVMNRHWTKCLHTRKWVILSLISAKVHGCCWLLEQAAHIILSAILCAMSNLIWRNGRRKRRGGLLNLHSHSHNQCSSTWSRKVFRLIRVNYLYLLIFLWISSAR